MLVTCALIPSSRTAAILASISPAADSNQLSTALSSSQSPPIMPESTATASTCASLASAGKEKGCVG